jgi:hypothetical protein
MHWQGFELRHALIPICATLVMMTACQIKTSSISTDSVGLVNVRLERQNRPISTDSLESGTYDLSCPNPDPSIRERCERYEEQILATVVRLEVRTPSLDDPSLLTESGGHGTIKDGRFIVVHNHFAIDLSIFADEAQRAQASLTLYGANGYMLLRDVHPPLFEIVVQDRETQVLDFGTNDEGEGFFDWYRVPSAPFRNSQEITIQAGSEVAQVNWDGQITYIDWVKVQKVITHDGVPRLLLENPINQGSSGGVWRWRLLEWSSYRQQLVDGWTYKRGRGGNISIQYCCP